MGATGVILPILVLGIAIGIAFFYPTFFPSVSPRFEQYNQTYTEALRLSRNNQSNQSQQLLNEFFKNYNASDDAFTLDYGLKGKALVLSALIDLNDSNPKVACPKAYEGGKRVISTEGTHSAAVGDAYYAMGWCHFFYANYSEAITILKQSQHVRSEVHGENASLTLEPRDLLSRIYLRTGSLGDALEESQDVLRIRHHEYKKFTMETLKSYLVMGELYDTLGYAEGGLKFKSNAWDVVEDNNLTSTMLGLNVLETLAISWLHWNNPPKAVYQINSVYNLKKDILPADNLNLWNCLYLYGKILQEKGDNDKAREKLEKVLDYRLKYWGPSHPDVGDVYYHIGLSYLNQSKWEPAAQNLEKAVAIYEKYFNNEYPIVFVAHDYYGYALAKTAQKEKGKSYLAKALEVANQYYPDNHYIVGNIYAHLADVARDEKKYDLAIEYDTKALESYRLYYGETEEIPFEHEEKLAWNHFLKGEADIAIGKLENLVERRKSSERPNPKKLKPIYQKLADIFEKKADLAKAAYYRSLNP